MLILTQAVTLLATHGWERASTPSFGHASLEAVCDWFSIPLEKAGIDISLVQEEWDDMVEYGKQYFNLVQDDYKVVWWKVFNCVDAKRWSNVLGVVELLLFCLPLSNGHLERVFSQLKFIKNDRCINLTENRLDQLLRIDCCGPPIDQWDPSNAISEWYKDRTRRVTASTRGTASSRAGRESDENDDDNEEFSLVAWKSWLQISSSEESGSESGDDCETEDRA